MMGSPRRAAVEATKQALREARLEVRSLERALSELEGESTNGGVRRSENGPRISREDRARQLTGQLREIPGEALSASDAHNRFGHPYASGLAALRFAHQQGWVKQVRSDDGKERYQYKEQRVRPGEPTKG
jgi:hypothetical protein